jgi:hypothetical protein
MEEYAEARTSIWRSGLGAVHQVGRLQIKILPGPDGRYVLAISLGGDGRSVRR